MAQNARRHRRGGDQCALSDGFKLVGRRRASADPHHEKDQQDRRRDWLPTARPRTSVQRGSWTSTCAARSCAKHQPVRLNRAYGSCSMRPAEWLVGRRRFSKAIAAQERSAPRAFCNRFRSRSLLFAFLSDGAGARSSDEADEGAAERLSSRFARARVCVFAPSTKSFQLQGRQADRKNRLVGRMARRLRTERDRLRGSLNVRPSNSDRCCKASRDASDQAGRCRAS